MRHAFAFPLEIRDAVRAYVRHAVRGLDMRGFHQEPAYTSALLGRLIGTPYDGPKGRVSISATSIASNGPRAAESWSGADFAITAEISDGYQEIRKAILSQAKLGELDELSNRESDRLKGQIRDMGKYVDHPKVMVIPDRDGERMPRMLSGNAILHGHPTSGIELPDYFVRRILTTFDGTTDPVVVEAVRDSRLRQLRLLAEI